ncbi:ankyrin repeat protein [Cordyceps militaris CM01]|uniref:Ankyrin repeat protein n=1 Tax=Cordyceps militaris (strain CM01) TaxID=983644 RepID=G3JUB4_CORMM|nr:ankyrin repeat protein [Cordyceps militaris CM01]EGX87821.1 ankyrin repeat protein [Cordyceps militaris CM01]
MPGQVGSRPRGFVPLPPRQTPDENINQLKTALLQDDLETFTRLLVSPVKANDLSAVMYEAIKKDRDRFVQGLLDFGMGTSYNFAFEAVRSEATSCLEVFLANGWDINQPQSETQPSILADAITNRKLALWLLDRGADLNKSTYVDMTPMSLAVQNASPDLVKTFLDLGGDVTKGELLHYVLDRPRSEAADTIEILAMLLNKGAPLNTVMYDKHAASRRLYPFIERGTALQKAVATGNADAVRYLLGRGADPTIKNSMGRDAVECAERSGHAFRLLSSPVAYSGTAWWEVRNSSTSLMITLNRFGELRLVSQSPALLAFRSISLIGGNDCLI